MTEDVKLPPLPEGRYDFWDDYYDGLTLSPAPDDRYQKIGLFDEDDMQAYARLAVLQERERCARLVEKTPAEAFCTVMHQAQLQHARETFAAAIRSGHSITETQRAEE